MSAVFTHGRLRLYLLKLLDDGPKHGYQLIRSLEDRFLGSYAPSAGTIYPRLQRMQAEGLVTHTAAGGRKVYEITEAGRAELRQRAGELVTLEEDIRASVADLAGLAGEIENEVRGSARDLKQELREAIRQARRAARDPSRQPVVGTGSTGPAERDAAAEFDRRLTELVAEVRLLARAAPLTDAQLRTASRMLDGLLDGLRRLLR